MAQQKNGLFLNPIDEVIILNHDATIEKMILEREAYAFYYQELYSILEKLGIKIRSLSRAQLLDYVHTSVHVSYRLDELSHPPDSQSPLVPQWIANYADLLEVLSPFGLFDHFLPIFSKIDINLDTLGSNYPDTVNPAYQIRSYQITNQVVSKCKPYMMTPNGFILSSSKSMLSPYRKMETLRWLDVLTSRDINPLPCIGQLSDFADISSRDLIFQNHLHPSFCFIGSGCWTNEAAVREILKREWIKCPVVIHVRDLFDRHVQLRPYLDTVLYVIENSIVINSEVIEGNQLKLRRLVQEYQWDREKGYQLSINDMPLLDYLKFRQFHVHIIPENVIHGGDKDTLSIIQLDQKNTSLSIVQLADQYLASMKQKSLVEYYKTKFCLRVHFISFPSNADVMDSITGLHPILPATDPIPSPSFQHQPELLWLPRTRHPFSEILRQTTNTVLMVTPIGFMSNCETRQDNYFMHQDKNRSPAALERLALLEFSALHQALINANIRVQVCCNERAFHTPDATFPNNWFSTHSNIELAQVKQSVQSTEAQPSQPVMSTCFLYPMKAPSRRAERQPYITDLLHTIYKRIIDLTLFEDNSTIPNLSINSNSPTSPCFLEGTGVLVLDRINRIAYCVLSQRANLQLFHHWCHLAQYQPISFHSVDQDHHSVYHTNVIMAICTRIAIICLESISCPVERQSVHQQLAITHTVIDITWQQASQFCANVLELHTLDQRRVLVMSSRAYHSFGDKIQIIAQEVDQIIHVSIPTIEDLGGGGVRCMMAELF